MKKGTIYGLIILFVLISFLVGLIIMSFRSDRKMKEAYSAFNDEYHEYTIEVTFLNGIVDTLIDGVIVTQREQYYGNDTKLMIGQEDISTRKQPLLSDVHLEIVKTHQRFGFGKIVCYNIQSFKVLDKRVLKQ